MCMSVAVDQIQFTKLQLNLQTYKQYLYYLIIINTKNPTSYTPTSPKKSMSPSLSSLTLTPNLTPTPKLFSLLILLFSTLLTLFTCQSKLYQVFALTRHGARYHSNDFYDGNQTRTRWYQLTAVGMRQLEKFGKLVRKQYIQSLQLLSKEYNQSQIQIFSTYYNRTYQSGLSFLYGLYPLSTGPRIDYVNRQYHLPPYSNKTDIDQNNYALPKAHQPIRIKSSQKILLSDCPNYQIYQKKNFALLNDTVFQMTTYYRPFIQKMSTLFNYNPSNASLLTLTRIYDTSSVNKYLNRPLPPLFTQQDYKNVQHITNWYFLLAMSNNNSLMANTFKLQRLINNFDLRTKLIQNYALKWTHMFVHDTDILAMHLALNTSSYTCIQQLYRTGSTKWQQCQTGAVLYSSNIIIQLHSNNNGKDFYIKVRSNGKYIKICSKGLYQCQYLEFKSLIKKSIANRSMEEICGKELKEYRYQWAYQYQQQQQKQQKQQQQKYNQLSFSWWIQKKWAMTQSGQNLLKQQ